MIVKYFVNFQILLDLTMNMLNTNVWIKFMKQWRSVVFTLNYIKTETEQSKYCNYWLLQRKEILDLKQYCFVKVN